MDGGTWIRLGALALFIGALVGGVTITAIGYFRLAIDGIVALVLAFFVAAGGTSLAAAKTRRSGKRVERVRQMRRRGRAAGGALGLLILVLVAVPLLDWLDAPGSLLDGGAAPVDWPLDVRYEIERFSGGGEALTTELHEFGGNGWDDWTAVAMRTDGIRGEVQRASDRSRYRGVMAVEETAEEPFASLDSARTTELDDSEPVEDPTGRIAPNGLMNTRFGTYREPGRARGGAERVLDDDLPDLRAQVAAELDLDSDTLVAQRIEQGCAQPNPRACYELRYVALPAARVPLYAEEISGETGLEARLRVTHVRIPDPVAALQPWTR